MEGWMFLLGIFAVALAILMLSRRPLTQKEYAFYEFFVAEARKQNISPTWMGRFLFENFEKLQGVYAKEHRGFVLNRSPRVRAYILEHYTVETVKISM